jgi:carbonic anhydrase
MSQSIEAFDKAIISRQPGFDELKVRSDFRKVIPNLKTVVVHCFDPRVTGGIPPAVAKALPGQIYPGDVFEFVDDDGKKRIGSNTTIFPVVVAGGRASGSVQHSVSVACHLFDIDNVVVVHHTDCGGTHFTPEGFLRTFKEEFEQDITDLWDPDDICLENFTQSLHRDVRSIRHSRGTPKHVNVYGYLYDIQTRELHLVEESLGDPAAPRGAAWRQ